MALSITLNSKDPLAIPADALVICVPQGKLEAQPILRAANGALHGSLLSHVARAEFQGKPEQILDLPTFGRLKAGRLVLVGAGPADTLDRAYLRGAVASAMRAGAQQGAKSAVLVLPAVDVDARAVGEALGLGGYRFTKYFTGERRPKSRIEKLVISGLGTGKKARGALELGLRLAGAVNLARDAINEPPNVLFPETLAQIARDIARSGRLKIKVLDKKGIRDAGMHLHHAVGQGSAHDPRFIHLTYAPRRGRARMVFVGKGLTFDSGGLCIKPAAGMGEMKSDMGGAAAVLGLMDAVAVLRPDVEVHGIVGAAENMPDGAAYRPADVFRSLDGKTVEVINTDAEGRLVLADALAYASRLKPDLLVDAATLTGAALVALGKTCSAFYTGDHQLAKTFEGAARAAGESFWRMPLIEELGEQLKSDVADLKHTGDRWGGSITAALFLREFVGKVPWIHCDIAGPVLSERARGVVPKGGTGHAVLTFLNLVEGFRR